MIKPLTWLAAFLAVLIIATVASAQTPSPTPTPAATPPSSNVFVADYQVKDGQIKLGKPIKINETNGYNNQPSFLSDGRGILYTSIRDKQLTFIATTSAAKLRHKSRTLLRVNTRRL